MRRNGIPRVCGGCGRVFPFMGSPAKIPAGGGKFCSRPCAYANKPRRTIEERFWAKVLRGDGCWLWATATKPHRYGSLASRENGRRNVEAHRTSWEIHFGPIPPGLQVLHQCDNRRCVRPDHLFLGTKRDNSIDMLLKDRSNRGERHGLAKLTESEVIEMRRRYSDEWVTIGQLAEEYGVSRSAVNGVIGLKTWTYLIG